jgi:hypothetical protein
MAVLGRLLLSSAERLDLPDLLSIDSYTAGDFKYLLKGLVNDTKPYILKGFEVINPNNAIGSTNIAIEIADSVVVYPGSSAGPFYHGLPAGDPLAQPLVPELRKNATNYVYLTFSTFDTSADTRAFWDPDKDGGVGGEFTQDVNTESVLQVQVNVSVASFPDNVIPICKVVTGPTVINSIQDCRDMMFRLGTGGINPDPFNTYAFRPLPSAPYARDEPPTTMTSALDPNPFEGGDKNIISLKEWMDAVMTKLKEIGGTNFWYESVLGSGVTVTGIFQDALASTFKSKGQWQHSSSTEGLLTWTEDLQIQSITDSRNYIIRAGSKTLADEQVMFLNLVRNKPINSGDSAVSWTNSSIYVNGLTGSFQFLAQGDWVKKDTDSDFQYLRVEQFYASGNGGGGVTSAALAQSIKLNATYSGTTQSEKAVYSKGVYQPADVAVASRADPSLTTAGGNLSWLALRSDTIEAVSGINSFTVSGNIIEANGVEAKFNATAHGLVDGDRITITNSVSGFNGTYVVDVEDADNFYIQSAINVNENSLTAFYALIVTTARSTADGLQLESATNNFESGETIKLSGTGTYDGAYAINVRSTLSFTIPVSSAIVPSSSGNAILARMNVRSESGIDRIVRGEIRNVGGAETDAMIKYVGQQNPTQSIPNYLTPAGSNTLPGYQNFNSSASDNLTARVSRLTAMMADRVQDRSMRLLGRVTIRNTTSGLNQAITASGTLSLNKPGDTAQTVTLTSTIPTNSAAVITFGRDSAAALTTTIESLGSPFILEENKLLLFIRLGGSEIYTWDGQVVPANGALTTNTPDDTQNKNVVVYNPGNVHLDTATNLVTFSQNVTGFVDILIPGSTGANRIDTVAINTLGTFMMTDGQAAWVRINRAAAKTFNVIQTSDVPDTNANGAIYITTLASVPVDQDAFVVYVRKNDDLIETQLGVLPKGNIYDEPLNVISGPPVDSNQITGPVPATTIITLPFDSRDSDTIQTYVVGSGMLELFLNGQYLELGVDWDEVGAINTESNQIEILELLVVGDELTFRIDPEGGVFFSSTGGGAQTLQDTYDNGRFITVNVGQPVTINGASGKLLDVNGDMTVTGVIDPKGMTFSPQATTPLQVSDNGIWVNTAGDLLHSRPSMSDVNITQSAAGQLPSASVNLTYKNATGSTIAALTPVIIDTNGDYAPINVALDTSTAIAGITAASILDMAYGDIVSNGRIADVSTAFNFGDTLYVSKTGGLTNVQPNIGGGGFIAGDFVIRVAVIAKNRLNPSNQDILVNINIIGQL